MPTAALTQVPPLVVPAQESVFESLGALATPALGYDLDGLDRSLGILRDDLETIPRAELNLALKSCHTPAVLRHLAGLGLGADVASIGELGLAVSAGFARITATGPSFAPRDLDLLDASGVTLDASSLDQLDDLWKARPEADLGIRLRVPLPPGIEDDVTTFGAHSRFGILATDPRLHAAVGSARGRITRFHTHTGQMTPEHLVYKTRYLLTAATRFPHVTHVDLGGGFFSLYASRSRARAAFEQVAADLRRWEQHTGRQLVLQFEPGGAVLAWHGYLTVTVVGVEIAHPGFGADVVTVDASAWNLAPWHRPQIMHLDASRHDDAPVPTRVAGNTLYENDFFGTDVRGAHTTFALPRCRVGDVLVMTASGAYTMTNSRRFNRIEPPGEFLIRDGQARPVG